MKKITLLLLAVFTMGYIANAQIVLTGTSYTQNFDGIGTALPTGWTVRTGATAAALGTEAQFAVATKSWTDKTGAFKNYASADGLTVGSDSTAQNASSDRALGLRQSSSFGNPGGAFVMQIANTLNKNSFEMSFKLQSLDTSSAYRTTWVVDYAVGANPTAFTPLTTVPSPLHTGANTFSNTNVTIDFGLLLDNINQPVWIRIVTLTAATGPSGANRASTAIDDVQLTWTEGAPTTTAAPFFTPTPGTYFAPIQVSMTSPTSGATIYFTTDGTTPTTASTEFTTPVAISTNTTIKAIAVKAGLDNSSVSEGIYQFGSSNQVNSIAELRQQVADNTTIYTLTSEAVLTFQQNYRKQKFVQDNTGAILIDDNSSVITTAYDIADGISNITGKLNSFHGMLQFVPVADPGAATSFANIITPEILTLTQLQDSAAMRQHQAKIIRIENVKFQDANGTIQFQTNRKYRLNQGGTIDSTFRTQFYDVNYINTPLPAGTGIITGILHLSYGKYNITARSSSDINLVVGVENYQTANLRIYPNPTTSILNIETENNANLVITNLLGQKVIEMNNLMGQTQINVSNLNKGVYFVSLHFNNGEIASQKLIIK